LAILILPLTEDKSLISLSSSEKKVLRSSSLKLFSFRVTLSRLAKTGAVLIAVTETCHLRMLLFVTSLTIKLIVLVSLPGLELKLLYKLFQIAVK